MSSLDIFVQTATISIALLGAGGIATLSVFDLPIIRSQPADRALPALRWLFSRGSHVFPTAIGLASIGFAQLAYASWPAKSSSVAHVLHGPNAGRISGFVTAAILSSTAAFYTMLFMTPNNFALIEENDKLGGSRSAESAKVRKAQNIQPGEHSFKESIDGKGSANQWTDLSGPQTKTVLESTPELDERIGKMLAIFQQQNMIRAAILASGGIVGLATALA